MLHHNRGKVHVPLQICLFMGSTPVVLRSKVRLESPTPFARSFRLLGGLLSHLVLSRHDYSKFALYAQSRVLMTK